jgi:hypothetical protein
VERLSFSAFSAAKDGKSLNNRYFFLADRFHEHTGDIGSIEQPAS